MTKEEFIEKKKDIYHRRRLLKEEEEELDEKYVESNQPYPIGSKVLLKFENEKNTKVYYIKGYEVFAYDVVPIFARELKNGGYNPRSRVMTPFYKYSMELITD